MSVKFIPTGYHTITTQLSVEGAAAAIEFYKKAFGAEQVGEVSIDPSGKKVWHSALRIGDSLFFVNDVFPEMGGTKSESSMWVYVTDCDASFKRATDAGGKPTMPPAETFWGDRMGQLVDPFGQKWVIATHVKDMTPAEMKAAEQAFVANMKK